nr:integrase, catalytic region, zinc finger, CCHC-type, peptidase aspartic, catalytic [Tanacetum cinerariifolium]
MHNNIMAAGSRDRPPLLAPGRYPQWRSRFLRYVDTRPNGEALKKCILSGPYKPTTVLVHAVEETDNSPAVPEHTTVETPSNMSPENKAHFLAEKEAIHLILTRIRDDIYSTVDAYQTAQEIWEAIERSTFNFFNNYSRNGQVNELRAEKLARNANPLALVATDQASQEPFYQSSRDKDMQNNFALIAKYFKKIYKPTNNNLRTSSNSKNKNVDTPLWYKNGDHSGQFGTQRTVNVAGTREKVGSRVVHKTGIQCFNCKEYGHFAKECRKPKRVKDSVYHKKKMMLYKQAEQGVPLQAKQYDWDRFRASGIESISVRDSYLVTFQNKQTEFEKYKAFNDRTVNYDKLEHKLNGALGQLAHKDTVIREDVMCSYLQSLSDLDALAELQCMYLHKVKECDCLAQKLLKQTESVSKKVHTELLQRFAKLEKHLISLEIALQKCKEQAKINAICNEKALNEFQKEREQYFQIQDLKAQMQDKNIAIRVNHKPNVSRPQLKSNQLKDKVLPNNSQVKVKKTQVEVHPRIPSDSNKMKYVTACKDSLNSRTLNANAVCATCNKCLVNSNHFACVTKMLNDVRARTKKPTVVPISSRKPKSQANKSILRKRLHQNPQNRNHRVTVGCCMRTPIVQLILFIVDSGCTKHMTGNLKLLCNFVEKFLGTVHFGNDQFATILGYGDLVQGNVTINRVYYVEFPLNHNLFSVGQFCDVDLEVAFRKSTCFVRDLQGNDLLIGNRGSDLYTISLQESTSSTPLCLMDKATPTQAWLWHRRLSHLNFDYINLLLKKDIVIGLLKLKYVKDQLCSSCELSKAKRSSFKSKAVPSLKGRLNLLYMDLCGLMRVASINRKKYILSTSAPSTHTNVHAEENNNDQAEEGEKLQDDEFTNPFYHPLEQVHGNPSRPVQAIRQLPTDPEMCMFALTVSTAELKNIKEAMADSAWIEAMQDKLHQTALYGLKQAPRAWYDELSKFLTSKGFTKGTIDPTLFTIRYEEDILLVQIYVDDIILGSTNPKYSKRLEKLMHSRFEMSLMGEMKFFLRHQIHQSPCGIFINQAKYTLEILHKHGMDKGQSIGTLMATKPKLDADLSGNLVDQTDYRSDKLVSWMSKKHNCTAMSSSEAEYVALSASCAQVIWMRTQLHDYGFNYNKIPLYCDSQTEYQLADMFTKALPEDRFKYLVRRIGMRCLTPAELENQKDLPKDTPWLEIAVLRYDGDECDKGRRLTKIELTLEQSQQGVSNDVLLLVSFDIKTMIEFNYKSRTYRFVKSEKRLEAYNLKEWKHIVFRNERWSNYSSFMEEALFKSAVRQKINGIFISQDKYVAEILRKFELTDGKLASIPIDIEKPLLKDPDGEDIDVHTFRSMIGSLMYVTSSRPDIMFAVCACARFQVTPKASHPRAVKRIFRYLKGKPHLGLWYP